MRLLRGRRQRAEHDLDLRDEGELATALTYTFVDDIEALGERLSAFDRRLDTLEARLREAENLAGLVPEQTDVLDVQVRAAKLAAELHMVTLEVERLRAGA